MAKTLAELAREQQQREQEQFLAELYPELIGLQLYASTEKITPWPTLALAKGLRLGAFRYDMYCPLCKQSATFNAQPLKADQERRRYEDENPQSLYRMAVGTQDFDWHSRFALRMTCARHDHPFDMYLASVITVHGAQEEGRPMQLNWKITKVGQYPSLRDMQLGDLKEIEEAMSTAQRKEFVQAISTGAHGFSVAACVYYRRVFEQLLDQARDEFAKDNPGADIDEIDRKYTDEKIKVLAAYLPPFLVEHPQLYAILSKGVHQLTEDECARELPTVRQAIEIILKEKVEAIRAAKRREAAKLLIAQSANRVK